MSRVKENYLQQQEQEAAIDLSYEEWLRDNFKQPSEVELDMMEEDLKKSSCLCNRIVPHKPLNNPTYNPIQTTGA